MDINSTLWWLDVIANRGDPARVSESFKERFEVLRKKLELLQNTTIMMEGSAKLSDDFNAIKAGLEQARLQEPASLKELFHDLSAHFQRVALWALDLNQTATAQTLKNLRDRERYARFSALAFVLTGCLTIFFLIIDVNRRKDLLQNAQQAERMKNSFFAMMSHEIRTPINGIMGTLALLQDTTLTPQQLQLLQTARGSAEGLLSIVNDVLDYSKIEAGKLEIEYADFSLRELVAHVVALMTPLAKEKGLAFSHTIAASLPDALHSDPARLRQIMLNFLSNAVKFTEKGFIHLDIRREEALRENEPEESLRFEVTDSGIGIAPESRRLLFREFSQIEGSHTRRFAGTGLGLAICAKLCSMLNGTVGLISEKGKGSTFWFSVPLLPAKAPLAEKNTVTCNVVNRVIHILLAEDNQTNQLITASFLQKAGHQVDIANNGEEALNKARDTLYELVLMDVSMPVMDGLTATRAIRALKGPWEQIPILAMTAHALPSDREECLRAGMNGYLSKPVSRENLMEALNRWAGTPVDPILSCTEALNSPRHNPDGSAVLTSTPLPPGINDVFPPAPVNPIPRPVRDDHFGRLLEDLGKDGLVLFVPAFRNDVQKTSQQMLDAAQEGSWNIVQIHAHSLRSSVLNFGLDDLSNLAADIEIQCLEKGKADTAMLSKWPQQLEASMSELDGKLKQHGLQEIG